MKQAAQGAQHPLAVGDRIDTDIAGAVNAGIDALLVLTGVSTAADLLATDSRPRYVAADIGALIDGGDELAIGPQDEWAVEGTDVGWRGNGDADPLTLLRALCAAHDGPRSFHATDETAAKALHDLGLDRID